MTTTYLSPDELRELTGSEVAGPQPLALRHRGDRPRLHAGFRAADARIVRGCFGR